MARNYAPSHSRIFTGSTRIRLTCFVLQPAKTPLALPPPLVLGPGLCRPVTDTPSIDLCLRKENGTRRKLFLSPLKRLNRIRRLAVQLRPHRMAGSPSIMVDSSNLSLG